MNSASLFPPQTLASLREQRTSIMDASTAPKEVRSRTTSWLRNASSSRTASRLGLRLKTPRPIISAPIGPIKNSRGPDFSRSERFVIVDEIKDCVSPTKKTKARAISARFPIEPLPSRPTVARSTVTASNTIQAPSRRNSDKNLRNVSLNALPKAPPTCLKTSATIALLPQIDSPEQDENTPPETNIPKPKIAPQSKLPKSRTMSALRELTNSISRPSPNARVNVTHESDTSSSLLFSSPFASIPPSSPSLRLREASQTSLRESRSCTPEANPLLVREAQPSAYWCGRFKSLYDKFSAEALTPVPMGSSPHKTQKNTCEPILSPGQTMSKPRPHLTRLPLSTTTPALTQAACTPTTIPRLSEEDERIRRVFRHLETLCETDEARSSLHDWQQAYARHHKRPRVHPPGQSSDSRSIVSRLFSGAQKTGRQSLATLQDPYSSRPVRRVATEHPSAARGAFAPAF